MDTRKHILVVEDDRHIAELLCLHLGDEGYDVVHAADGGEGLRLLETGTWDALVLDLMLPSMDGLELCKRARSMTRYTPIIITSARSSEVHRILGLELGADDYLAKPFSMLELVARVKALLRRTDAMSRNLRADAGTLELDGLRIDPLITPHPLYWALGNTPFARERAYADLVEGAPGSPRQAELARGLRTAWALGGDAFVADLARRTQRRVSRTRPGRPRKAVEDLAAPDHAALPQQQ